MTTRAIGLSILSTNRHVRGANESLLPITHLCFIWGLFSILSHLLVNSCQKERGKENGLF